MVDAADHLAPMPLRRKKWTEEEEAALISKYGELLRSGFLSKAKSRERKFEPIAAHVNALFHARNPVAYPWLWTWKDASTKVQNMRHQYLGVKAKIRKLVDDEEIFEWEDGLSQWSNFLKYKDVFGDQELDVNEFFLVPANHHHRHNVLPSSMSLHEQHPACRPSLSLRASNKVGAHRFSKDVVNHGINIGDENGGLLLPPVKDTAVPIAVLNEQTGDLAMGLDFEDDGDEHGLRNGEDHFEDANDVGMEYSRLKRARLNGKLEPNVTFSSSESHVLVFIADQFTQFNERLAQREQRDFERQKDCEKMQSHFEAELTKHKEEWDRERKEMESMWRREMDKRDAEWKEKELKNIVMDQERREEEKERDKVRSENMERDRMEWREKMETQAMQHQAAMMQIQLQIAQSFQNTVGALSGVIAQIAGQGSDFVMQGGSMNPFVSQLLQNLQTHGTGMVPFNVKRGAGESSDSHFDADG